MSDKEFSKRLTRLRENINDEGIRIRRYTMDPRIKKTASPDQPPPNEELRLELEAGWQQWFDLKKSFAALPDSPGVPAVADLEMKCLEVERAIDLVQRDLVSASSFKAGLNTVIWLSAVLVALVGLYFFTHGVHSLDFTTFEPWSDWGPMKYGEVAFWSAFGALCSLLFRASKYLARRDFDKWYQPWYLTTFIRAPFLTVILMMVILEFVEWYGEDTWLQAYLLEEGTKFYFIVFMSFCLGLATDVTAGILGDLADGVTDFAGRVAGRVSGRLSSAVSKDV
jgi:hypothetical protein